MSIGRIPVYVARNINGDAPDREGMISTPFRKIFAIICLSPVSPKAVAYEVYFGDSLVIDGKKMAETTENYADYIQILTSGAGPRREMYEKMNCSTETFSFSGEAFTDSNGNGTWDAGEPFADSNGNGANESGLDKAVSNYDMRQGFIAYMQGANDAAAVPDVAYFNVWVNPRIHPAAGAT